MSVKRSASIIAAVLIAGCASEPSAIEQNLVSPSASTASRPASAIPSVAAANALDDVDQGTTIQHFNRAMESAPTGQAVTWSNPGGTTVQLTATRTFQQADGTYCREFSETITADGKPNAARGTACRQSDATWQIVS